ncbi:MAG: hypothetical protein J6W35_07955 [Eubacterium sp.]|nr:hypothetical protein [Eubacterium sp.]
MKNKKWGTINSDAPVYVILFVSRNKDNTDVEGFVERRKSFISQQPIEELMPAFHDFIEKGVTGEFCRFYRSVNARDMGVVRKKLLHFLIEEDDFNLCCIRSKVAGFAAQKECAIEKKWLIDFDTREPEKLNEFLEYISEKDETIEATVNDTPNGCAIVLSHGFNSQDFAEKWGEVATIKKDDLLFIDGRAKMGLVVW